MKAPASSAAPSCSRRAAPHRSPGASASRPGNVPCRRKEAATSSAPAPAGASRAGSGPYWADWASLRAITASSPYQARPSGSRSARSSAWCPRGASSRRVVPSRSRTVSSSSCSAATRRARVHLVADLDRVALDWVRPVELARQLVPPPGGALGLVLRVRGRARCRLDRTLQLLEALLVAHHLAEQPSRLLVVLGLPGQLLDRLPGDPLELVDPLPERRDLGLRGRKHLGRIGPQARLRPLVGVLLARRPAPSRARHLSEQG